MLLLLLSSVTDVLMYFGIFYKVFFDRSRRRIGFGISKSDICSQIARAKDIDVYGKNDLATPGNGCRIGSGSGGGCP